ncbi:MAG TPA: DUF72 domain-containing protein [Actinomycetota bacterium]|nr:DUF72 domain-containing protein [Actinomycetota bacterium]
MSGRLLVGTSGFAYKEWKGNFYPEGTSDRKMLNYYSSRLGTVEINYTFRRLPSESTIEGWRSQTEEGFRFTLKAHQRITHYMRLREVDEQVSEFVGRAKLLGDRLGTILFQLPPNMSYSREVLEHFLHCLPPSVRYAMEFRHASWDVAEVKDLLGAAGVALCGADTDEAALDEVPVLAPYVYLRLRKEDYSPDELTAWAGKIKPVLDEGVDVYCYFKHEGGGVGPQLALGLLGRIGS